jgi:hypothetical protein
MREQSKWEEKKDGRSKKFQTLRKMKMWNKERNQEAKKLLLRFLMVERNNEGNWQGYFL